MREERGKEGGKEGNLGTDTVVEEENTELLRLERNLENALCTALYM